MTEVAPNSPIISNSLREELIMAFQNLLESENEVVEQTVPPNLCDDPEVFSHASFEEFAFMHTDYAQSLEQEVEKLMRKFPAGYKHHSIHMISNTINVSVVIGMSMNQFQKLFTVVYDDLKMLYPYCPMELKNNHEARTLDGDYDEVHYIRGCENNLKLFLCLYRLKTGCSFRHMELIFGWAHNSIVEWFEVICLLLNRKLETYHVNIMDTLGPNRIQHQANIWKEKVVEEGKFEPFQRRFVDYNNRKDEKKKVMIPSDDDETFMGSIGAIDGTYTLRSRLSYKRYLERVGLSADIECSEFVRRHLWKLSIISSHSIGPNQQELLLNVSLHPGEINNPDAYSYDQMPEFRKYIPLGCCLLGDKEYLGEFFVLPPYPTQSMDTANADDGAFMASFNHDHSHHLNCSKHGIAFLKQWGIVRGRSDFDQFHSDEWYWCCVQICWGLHNFLVLDAPRM